jgi:hypothetical protein
LYSSDDEVDDPCQHWCSEVEFQKGAKRSMVMSSPSSSDAPPTKAAKASGEEEGQKATVEIQLQSEDSKVFKRKRGAGKINDTLNHTRKVEKKLTDLLVAIPAVKAIRKQIVEMPVVVPLRGRGRPPAALRGLPASVAVTLTVPRSNSSRLKALPTRLKDIGV